MEGPPSFTKASATQKAEGAARCHAWQRARTTGSAAMRALWMAASPLRMYSRQERSEAQRP
eukprot:153863-Lingulodinium_polyedra.AAC.1